MKSFDLIVVGSGSGLEVSSEASDLGLSVAVVESGPFAQGVTGKSVLVLAGTGNNGGGGLVAARHLSNMGARVRVILSSGAHELREMPARQASILTRMGVETLEWTPSDEAPLAEVFSGPAVIVDALLGYSLSGAPRGGAARLIEQANACGKPIVALDVPSGVSATDARVYEPAIRATATLTLALPKTALASEEARASSGDLYLADISVPPSLYRRMGLAVESPFANGSPIPLLWTAAGWVTGC